MPLGCSGNFGVCFAAPNLGDDLGGGLSHAPPPDPFIEKYKTGNHNYDHKDETDYLRKTGLRRVMINDTKKDREIVANVKS